jgi:hypothetical protein
MYNIYVYDSDSNKLFNYESQIVPQKGDTYADPTNCPGLWKVTQRVLHTTPDCSNVITIRVKKISEPLDL